VTTPESVSPEIEPVTGSSWRGYVYILGSVVSTAAAIHINREALEYMSPSLNAMINCLIAPTYLIVLASLWGWRKGTPARQLPTPAGVVRCFRSAWRPVVLAVLAGGAGSVLELWVLSMYGAATTTFLSNQRLVFIVLGGVLMGERLVRGEVGAILLVLAGALLFSYQGGRIMLPAVGIMIAATLGHTVKQLCVKRAADRLPQIQVMCGVLVGIAAFSAVVTAITRTYTWPPAVAWGLMAAAAALGSGAGMTMLYASYRHIGVSRGGTMGSLRPLAVLLMGLALGAPLPAPLRLAGGAMILIGSAVLAGHHRGRPREGAN
jgi:drug/metabolite transporter (DMT)-like permease